MLCDGCTQELVEATKTDVGRCEFEIVFPVGVVLGEVAHVCPDCWAPIEAALNAGTEQ